MPPTDDRSVNIRPGESGRRARWPLIAVVAVLATGCGSVAGTRTGSTGPAVLTVNTSLPPSSTVPGAGNVTTLAAPPFGTASTPSAVWGDGGIYAWFGSDAAFYSPATNQWRPLPASGVHDAPDAIVAWVGTMLVVWDGTRGEGARYSPTTGMWRPVAAAPITGRTRHVAAAVATDNELFVWAGASPDGSLAADGAFYDPTIDQWTTIPAGPLTPRAFAAATWTGTEVVVWGDTTTPNENTGALGDGAAYNPTVNRWRPSAPAVLEPGITSGIWTGTDVLYAPTRSGNANGMFASTIAASYNPTSDTWRQVPLQAGHPGFQPGWDGHLLLLFAKGTGIAIDPTTGHTAAIVNATGVTLPTPAAVVSHQGTVYLVGNQRLLAITS